MTHTWTPRSSDDVARASARKSDRLYALYHGLVLVYGGFLLGVLSHALWVGDYDLIPRVIPFSCLFLLLVTGMVWWRRRRGLT